MIIFSEEKLYNDVKALLVSHLNTYITAINNYYNDAYSLPSMAEKNIVFGKAGEIMQGDMVQNDLLVFSISDNAERIGDETAELTTQLEISYLSRGLIDDDNGEKRWRVVSRMINAVLNCIRDNQYELQGLNGYEIAGRIDTSLNDGRGYYNKTITLTNLQAL